MLAGQRGDAGDRGQDVNLAQGAVPRKLSLPGENPPVTGRGGRREEAVGVGQHLFPRQIPWLSPIYICHSASVSTLLEAEADEAARDSKGRIA